MYKAHSKFSILFIVFLFCNFNSIAQDTLSNSFTPQFEPGRYYMITTIYGGTYRGLVIEENLKDFVILEKKTNTKQRLFKYQIKEVSIINASKAFQAPRFDDNYYTNYYMISENALPFKKRGFNSTSHYFLISNLNYSFNEHWGISMNLLIFLPSSVGVKCSYKVAQDIYFGANAYAYVVPNTNFHGLFCPIFGSAARVTKGDNVVNFSLGGGVMAIRNDNNNFSTQNQDPYFPIYYLNFSYANRFSKHLAINIESFVFPQTISYSRSNTNLNLTGVSLKWIRNYADHWNFGCYGAYIGSFTNLNKSSRIIPLPYIGYSTFFN